LTKLTKIGIKKSILNYVLNILNIQKCD